MKLVPQNQLLDNAKLNTVILSTKDQESRFTITKFLHLKCAFLNIIIR
jgi:hypothetical protein